ncbi:MAG: hypothetical protein V3V28_13395 [Polaribacter sp.]|uniref:hypothetical protein n=1 Tax=Polaribacter sp. TaxID=1920175 RepID=UPI002F359D13
MKNLKKLSVIIFAVALTSFSLISCEEAIDAGCSAETAQENYLKAINTFSSNPTRTNCNNLKSKANAFIDAAERCGGFDASAAHTSINQIDCSDF